MCMHIQHANRSSSLPPLSPTCKQPPCRMSRLGRAHQQNRERRIKDGRQTQQDQLLLRRAKSIRHAMVHSTARTHFGKEGMRHSLLSGQRVGREEMAYHHIGTTRSSCKHHADLYQECD
ncbi:hypothetical protein CY34DRAFT_662033 [Suillus luteus UH-Slu-Lm8-n1]|uniref:Uncharacterized protein n=1 Tax=Suillus luteus UH-Slu-Lm8-n1 TaxID=930992 RepID=A0A0C9Z9A0_9AGAM|nr:hypothetical protein CY34DRAFT_662033 [Suillus luteus UH-Slu-Lm8-n1]